MTIKKLSLMAILTAIALIIFIVEAQIPLPVPIPGVKLGLANAVTLFALFYTTLNHPPSAKAPSPYFTAINVFTILLCRIILGAVFTGRPVAFIYSAAGGLLALSAQVIIKRFVTEKQIWVCGAVGAVFHNIGQIIAAILITGTPAIAAYLPVLIVTGVFTGLLTGLIAQLTLERLQKGSFKQ
jgi:heptaprenyl diphosphate synthase